MVSPGNLAIASATTAPARRRSGFSLVDVLDGLLRARFGAQLGRLIAIVVVIGFGIATPFAARAAAGDASGALYVRALYWLSWMSAGWIGLSAAGRGVPEESAAVASLAIRRGHAASAIAVYEAFAVMRRLARVVGISAFVLGIVMIGSSRSLTGLGVHFALAVAGVGYALVLSGVLALIVQVARRASPEHGRSLFLAIIFAPHVARGLFPGFPSVPAVFGWMLGFLRSVGGVVS